MERYESIINILNKNEFYRYDKDSEIHSFLRLGSLGTYRIDISEKSFYELNEINIKIYKDLRRILDKKFAEDDAYFQAQRDQGG